MGLEPEKPRGKTLGEIIDAYLLDESPRLKASTVISKRKVLDRLKRDRGGDVAAGFSPAAALAWLDEQAWGQSLRWLASCIIKTVFRWAARPKADRGGGLLEENPIGSLKLPAPRSRGAETVVNPEAHARLMAVAPPCYRAVLMALHATGCRPGEVCQVEARHFNPAAGVWLLDEHKTRHRTNKVRVIYLTPELVELCRSLAEKKPCGPLFRNSRGKPLIPERVRLWVFKTKRRLGIEGHIFPYVYRHTFATDALSKGVPDAQVAELLGHSGTAMLHQHYAHLTDRSQVLRSALGQVRDSRGGTEGQGA